MKRLKVSFMLLVVALLAASAVFNRVANSQGQSPSTYPNTPLTAAQSAALETTTRTPLASCHAVNLIWIRGFIELAARGGT